VAIVTSTARRIVDQEPASSQREFGCHLLSRS
jgi:hypothetical protein